MLQKTLATKLAILFQPQQASVNGMRRLRSPELTLFSRNGARKYLTPAERMRFQRALESLEPTERLFCEVLMWSGGRVSEVLAVTAGAIDLDSGDIALVTLKRRRTGLVRQIPLPRPILRALATQFNIRTLQRDPARVRARLWPWSRTTAWRLVKKVMARALITTPAASPKGLRHTFGVRAFQASVPPHLVQRWLGHASLRTTGIYADVSGNEERQIARKMWRGVR